MTFKEKWIEFIYRTATGNFKKKIIITPIAGILFLFISSLFVFVPIYIEKLLNIPHLWSSPLNYILSVPFFILGLILVIWTNFIFIRIKGSPVPLNPPPKLITTGSFAFSRNPMTGGLFLLMFGFGFYYSSILSIIIFIPLYIFFHVKELKAIEEPELIKRLGDDYIEYRKKVPMFFPWKPRR